MGLRLGVESLGGGGIFIVKFYSIHVSREMKRTALQTRVDLRGRRISAGLTIDTSLGIQDVSACVTDGVVGVAGGNRKEPVRSGHAAEYEVVESASVTLTPPTSTHTHPHCSLSPTSHHTKSCRLTTTCQWRTLHTGLIRHPGLLCPKDITYGVSSGFRVRGRG